MLARRLISLQGCCAHRVAGLSTHPGNEADRVLAYWQSLLQDRAPEGGQLEEGEVKELLATAIRLRQGKAQVSRALAWLRGTVEPTGTLEPASASAA